MKIISSKDVKEFLLEDIVESGKAIAEKLVAARCPICRQELIDGFSMCDCTKSLLQEY
ncbi:MAG TPA: hypothetical protein VMV86_03020 [Methanosarcinales archaeon]|nr:hypothetical protein [Methanosarcinales archaeon]